MNYTREDLMKSLQELGVTSLELFDELTQYQDTSTNHLKKAAALKRLVSINQSDVHTKLSELKTHTAAAIKLQREQKNG